MSSELICSLNHFAWSSAVEISISGWTYAASAVQAKEIYIMKIMWKEQLDYYLAQNRISLIDWPVTGHGQ